MEHVRKLAKDLSTATGPNQMIDILLALSEEIDALDPREFAPEYRSEFAIIRGNIRRTAADAPQKGVKTDVAHNLAQRAMKVMDGYGTGGQVLRRDFRWLSDPSFRDIVQRDYRELATKLVPDGAWKSAVVMAGSIVEAVLVDLVFNDPVRLAEAKKPANVPKYQDNTPKPEKKWVLQDLIFVATKIGLIPTERANTFDQILRDYRNFVHPRKEIRSGHHCGEGEAYMAKGALDALCDHFDRMFTPTASPAPPAAP